MALTELTQKTQEDDAVKPTNALAAIEKAANTEPPINPQTATP